MASKSLGRRLGKTPGLESGLESPLGPETSPPRQSRNGALRQPRLRASCDGCFVAKVKCTKARPLCGRCLSNGLDCRYSPSSRTGKPKQEKVTPTKADIELVNLPQHVFDTPHMLHPYSSHFGSPQVPQQSPHFADNGQHFFTDFQAPESAQYLDPQHIGSIANFNMGLGQQIQPYAFGVGFPAPPSPDGVPQINLFDMNAWADTPPLSESESGNSNETMPLLKDEDLDGPGDMFPGTTTPWTHSHQQAAALNVEPSAKHSAQPSLPHQDMNLQQFPDALGTHEITDEMAPGISFMAAPNASHRRYSNGPVRQSSLQQGFRSHMRSQSLDQLPFGPDFWPSHEGDGQFFGYCPVPYANSAPQTHAPSPVNAPESFSPDLRNQHNIQLRMQSMNNAFVPNYSNEIDQ